MKSKPLHLLVVISGHGYGHAAMTAPVVNRLHHDFPELKITLRTQVPLTFIKNKFSAPFEYLPEATDFGMVMNSAFEVDLDASYQAYSALHMRWDENIEQECARIKALDADLIISNIAYLPLAAARQLNIPAIALCCLNWADIFKHYFQNKPGSEKIYQQMIDAYRHANDFIRPEPAMPMPSLATQRAGPIAAIGNDKKQAMLEQLQLNADTRLVLVSMGGIETAINSNNWPQPGNVHYLVPSHGHKTASSKRTDISSLDEINFGFTDAIRSCDLFLTKPGYGSFTEAACNGTPILYIHRDNWPEQIALTDWLSEHLPCREITTEAFEAGHFADELVALLECSRPNILCPSGIEETIDLIKPYLFAQYG